MTQFSWISQRSDERLAEVITTKIINQLEGISSVLDVGCGDGIVESYLSEGVSYFGIDIEDACIYDQQPSTHVVYVDSADLSKSISSAPSYNCALLLDVLEHTEDFYLLAFEVARRNPKFIVISLPNELFVYDRLRLLLGKEHPAHSLDLIDLPAGFKHQFIINIEKATDILSERLSPSSYSLIKVFDRELIPKHPFQRPIMKILKKLSTPALSSMGRVLVYEKVSYS